MRIDDLNRAGKTQGAEKTDQTAQKRAGDKSTTVTGTDQADVSRLAHALATNDPQRLERLRLEVQSGKYEISAEAVAKAIIDAHYSE
jgi:anti-sigma28 factor (negative regulator of flagellin synthesis)